MIPYPIPALQGLTILVTRPAAQAKALCQAIEMHGGCAIPLPVIAIEAVTINSLTDTAQYDWVVFISANAVEHGLHRVHCAATAKIAAIGKTTTTALIAQKMTVHASPLGEASSETLLAHPALLELTEKRVLIVRGVGGRELLREELTRRGASVDVLEVYRRTKVQFEPEALSQLEQRWQTDGIDVVTITSVEILENLWAILSPTGRTLLSRTPIVVVSERIAQAARELGLHHMHILSRSADDDTLLGSIANWHTRAHL